MKITGPKWVKRAHQWCVTTITANKSMSAKHSTTQTLYWFSTEDEALNKVKELGEANKEN